MIFVGVIDVKKAYYLFNPGRLSRQDNTIRFTAINEEGNEQKPRYIPVEAISDLYVFGVVDANSVVYNFLAQKKIAVHFFDYYEHYTGSFMPRDYLLAGKMQVEQTKHYTSKPKRMILAKNFIEAAQFNMQKNIRYYHNRQQNIHSELEEIEQLASNIHAAKTPSELMGVEGNIRQLYYQSFNKIIKDFTMNGRTRQPPKDEINVLISFGNMMCYTTCLDCIYHTQLNPTISFLHEPGARRYSLALDLAEIFKPILVDRVIFKVLNRKEIKKNDFLQELNRCTLTDNARKKFIKAYEEKLKETIQHRSLKKKVSYKHLIKLECYKISKHILGVQDYKPFKIWW